MRVRSKEQNLPFTGYKAEHSHACNKRHKHPLTRTRTAMSSSTAFQTFSIENDVLSVPAQDAIWKFDADENRKINREAPWSKEYASRACA